MFVAFSRGQYVYIRFLGKTRTWIAMSVQTKDFADVNEHMDEIFRFRQPKVNEHVMSLRATAATTIMCSVIFWVFASLNKRILMDAPIDREDIQWE